MARRLAEAIVVLHPLAMKRPYSVPTAIGKKARGRRAAYWRHRESLERRDSFVTELTSFAPSACVIDVGQAR
jgi:hypothetical protein